MNGKFQRLAQQASRLGQGPIFISPDVAVCPRLPRGSVDPADRRYGYPFLNCTNCGPRLTIVTDAPYDRSRTTMAGFPMCAACRAEYQTRPTAASTPSRRPVPLRSAAGAARAGENVPTPDPLAVFAAALLGRIGRSRASAAITWPATPATPRPSRNCGDASTATKSRSPSWCATSKRRRRFATLPERRLWNRRAGRLSCCGNDPRTPASPQATQEPAGSKPAGSCVACGLADVGSRRRGRGAGQSRAWRHAAPTRRCTICSCMPPATCRW